MKIDLQIAVTLTRVNGYSDLVIEHIEEGNLGVARLLLYEELDAYKQASILLKESTSKIFIDFFSDWLPVKIKDVRFAIQKVEDLLHERTHSEITFTN